MSTDDSLFLLVKFGELLMGPSSETLLTPVTASPVVTGAKSTVYAITSTPP